MRGDLENQPAEIEPSERLHFPSIAADVSGLVLGAPVAAIDARIGDALAKVGEFYAVDRITLRWLDEAQTVLQRTHQWLRSSEALPPRFLSLAEVPYLGKRILLGEVVRVRRLEELPAEAKAEAEILRSLGTRSALAIPLVIEEVLVGAIILSTGREERDWSDAMVAEIQLLGAMMASAFARGSADTALREAEERFGALFSGTFFCIWTNDFEGRFLDANDATLGLLGYTGDEFRSLSFASLLDEDQLVEAYRALEEIQKNGSMKEPLPLEARTKAGEVIWVEAIGHLVARRGEPHAIQGIARNITERKRMEESLRESEARYRRLATNASDLIWVTDMNLVLTYVSPAVTKLRGFSIEEALAQTVDDWMTPASAELAGRILAEELAIDSRGQAEPSRSRPIELEMKHKNGSTTWTEVNASLLRDAAGKPTAILGISRDINKRKLNEEALARRLDQRNLLAVVSAGLLRASADEMDQQIVLTLERICGLHCLRDATLWWFDDARERATRSHAWNGFAPGEFRVSDAPWLARRVLEGQITQVCRLADLPAEAGMERDLLARVGIASILLVPLRVEETLLGFATFALDRESEWSDETLEEFQLLSNVLANSFARSRAMVDLRQREEDLRKAQQVGHVGSYVAYPATGRAEFSDELCAILGFEPGKTLTDLGMASVHPEDRERLLEIRQRARKGAVPPEAKYRVLRSDGSIRHVHDRWQIERDSRGEPVRFLGTVADITAHKEAETALRDALTEVTRLKERIEAENVYLREETFIARGFRDLVGESPEFKECLRLVHQVAPTDSTVLILGETGTGKELIARALHASSLRREGPLVSVNCAALPETLIESELFGHEKGAFTGALERRRGRFEFASGGTLFLDEIGDLPLHLQAKLLRVLQEGEIERVGGSEVIPVDVRVIGSTHRDLVRAMETGEFRADLYYRISGFPIHVPPLRDRVGDVPLLAKHFVHKHSLRLGRQISSISSRTLRSLSAYSWPGNVRELEHFIERVLIASTGPVLSLAGPPEALLACGSPQAPAMAATSLREAERGHIERVLETTHWVIEGSRGAAELLNIAPSTLRSRMKKLGIARPA